MRDFDNPNKHLKYRKLPYATLKENERTYIIYNMYRQGYLEGEDVSGLIKKFLLKSTIFYSFPFLFYALAKKATKNHIPEVPHWTKGSRCRYIMIATGLTWYSLNFICPFGWSYRKEKLKLMEYIDVNVGYDLYKFNAMLPRSWVDGRVNLMLLNEYISRHYFGNGFYAPPEGIQSTYLAKEEAMLNE